MRQWGDWSYAKLHQEDMTTLQLFSWFDAEGGRANISRNCEFTCTCTHRDWIEHQRPRYVAPGGLRRFVLRPVVTPHGPRILSCTVDGSGSERKLQKLFGCRTWLNLDLMCKNTV